MVDWGGRNRGGEMADRENSGYEMIGKARLRLWREHAEELAREFGLNSDVSAIFVLGYVRGRLAANLEWEMNMAKHVLDETATNREVHTLLKEGK